MSTRPLLPLSQAVLPLYAGVDLGGTNIKAALVDDEGRIVAFHTEPTHADRGPEDAAARMGRAVHTLAGMAGIATSDIAAVGLGTPGPQDLRTGVIIRAGNLPGWDDFPIRDRVAAHCGHRVTYANDATAAGYGEFWVGSGRDYSSLVLLTLGTGIGGGIIIGEMSIDGAHSHGSECGHIIVDPSDTARRCPCGQLGHLEAYTSETSLVARGREAASGDPLALDLLMETARWLGIGIVTLMHTIDPEAVILGGAMLFGGEEAPVGRAFIERVRAEVKRRTFPLLAAKTPIRFASLAGDAGSIGAAGLARLEHRRGKA